MFSKATKSIFESKKSFNASEGDRTIVLPRLLKDVFTTTPYPLICFTLQYFLKNDSLKYYLVLC